MDLEMLVVIILGNLLAILCFWLSGVPAVFMALRREDQARATPKEEYK